MKLSDNVNEKGDRFAGLLLHISSLPGKYGIGTLGKEAYDFVDFLKKYGVKYWQILPIMQTGFGDSPYQSVFTLSSNPYFIDPDTLKNEGLLSEKERKSAQMPKNKSAVDYGALYAVRYPLLRKAFARFDRSDAAFQAFLQEGKFRDYAEYMTLKTLQNNRCFAEWEKKYKENDRAAVEKAIAEHEEEYLFRQWLQFEFFREWRALKRYANERGVLLIGDLPLYTAYDSADVWAHPELFRLNKRRAMTEVAGVPPDYFSATGQLWGNPLYDWKRHEKEGYRWWIGRIGEALTTFDAVRLDHFRGFDRYFAIPAAAETAVGGVWRRGPKEKFFSAAKESIGPLNVIAEDLGTLDDGVLRLMKKTGFPGMKILLFAFEGGENPYLPKNIGKNSVTYTGTHDNDTVIGYLDRLSLSQKREVRKNLRAALESRGLYNPLRSKGQYLDAFIHLLFECDSRLSVLPVQDLLGLDNGARMNEPSTSGVNWKFRLKKMPSEKDGEYLAEILKKYGRFAR